MATRVECPSCRQQFTVEETPPSGVCSCSHCGRSVTLGHSRIADAAEETLRDLLLDEGLVTRAQVDEAARTVAVARRKGRRLALSEVLVERNFITRGQIEEALDQTGAPGAAVIPGYQIVEELGRGGMGTVYRGVHDASGKDVAIKVLAARLARQKDFLKRFHREARVAIELDHPNIVKGYDEGVCGRNHYFVMEYVKGKGADRILKKRKRFGERRAMDIARQTARALQYAHERGLVHRDIKPDNLILTRDGTVKLADYGLVKLADDAGSLGLTASGQIMGTPHYLSPEQAAGERDIDIRSDIYSLGATLYHFLAGTTPFTGKGSAEIMAMHIHGELKDPREWNDEISEPAARIVLTMMARSREERHQTPARLLAAIEDYFRSAGMRGRDDLAQELEAEQAAASGSGLIRRILTGPARTAVALGGAAAAGLFAVLLAALLLQPPTADEDAFALPAPVVETEARLAEALDASRSDRRVALEALARTRPETDAAWRAKALLLCESGGEEPGGDADRLAEAARLAIRMEAAPHPAVAEALRLRLADEYPDTPPGERAAEQIAEAERRRAEAEARRLAAERRRREVERRRHEREAREAAAAEALEIVELLRETPDVYIERLEAFVETPAYHDTRAHDQAKAALAETRRAVRAAERREAQRRKAEEEREALAGLRVAVVKAFARRRFDDLAAAMRAFGESDVLAEHRDAAAPWLRDWERLGRFNRSVVEGLDAFVGTNVRLRTEHGETIIGKLRRVEEEEERVLVVTRSGKEIWRRIRSIVAGQKAAYAREGYEGEAWEADVMCGLYLLMAGEAEDAARAFARAGDRDPDREHHEALLRDVRAYRGNF